MSKVLPFPFHIKVWNGSSWQMPSVYRFLSVSDHVQIFHCSLESALREVDLLRSEFGVDACVFLFGSCLSGELSVPCHV